MPLSPELLDRLAECWRRCGWPGAHQLRPGLDAAALARALAPFAGPVPAELRLWWGWHDSAGDGEPSIAAGLQWLKAEFAVRRYTVQREALTENAEQEGVDLETLAPRAWLPLFWTGSPAVFVADCTAAGPGAPIRYFNPHPDPEDRFLAWASLGDMVHQLCEAYDAGLQRWDPVANRWVRAPGGRKRPWL